MEIFVHRTFNAKAFERSFIHYDFGLFQWSLFQWSLCVLHALLLNAFLSHALNEWRFQRQNCKHMSTQKCKVGRWLTLKNNNVTNRLVMTKYIIQCMCKLFKNKNYFSLHPNVQSPAVATQHPRTAGEQASPAPAKGVLSAPHYH